MEPSTNSISLSCHCGHARQTVTPRCTGNLFSDLSFCHCDTCRYTTGLLCTSYVPIASTPRPNFSGLLGYWTGPLSARYFCQTCGCHVFRAKRPSEFALEDEWEWEVATGVIIDAPEEPDNNPQPKNWRHAHAEDTRDGGLSVWMPHTDNTLAFSSLSTADTHKTGPETEVDHDTPLLASCHCTAITLSITRPRPFSPDNPGSPFPDLLLPYCSTPSATIANPSNVKWYLRDPNPSLLEAEGRRHHRYLAGTCACPSCRQTSGFEIQTWAFIPRRNISIRHHEAGLQSSTSAPGSTSPVYTYIPLDFGSHPSSSHSTTTATPHPHLKAYESSPSKYRNFCGQCGATVFWHDDERPDLIDVSAGLFRSLSSGGSGTGEGARAEGWLEWWTGRVSFSEQAGKGRSGAAKAFGEGVVKWLEAGFGSPAAA